MSSLWKVIAAVVLVVGVSVTVDHCYSANADEWERRAEAAIATSKQLRSRVEALQSEADQLRSQAVAAAEAAEAREPQIIEKIVNLPPAVTPGEEARDEIIVEVQAQSDRWKLAYNSESAAHDKTREALFHALVRGDSLQITLEERPSKKPWWIPELSVGPQAGISYPSGKPYVGFGVTLGWKVSP
jgi:outer membrane murein-binding lipoprotein Lpp